MLLTAAATPAADKTSVGDVLQYFKPTHQKTYLNESQDRLIKKKSFKLSDVPDIEPVSNPEIGIYAELNTNPEQAEQLASRPDIDGLSAILTWRELEPAEGEYNWKPIDNLVEIATKHKKSLILRVSTAGININGKSDTPDWVFEGGTAKSIQYKDADGKKREIPLFWDATYLAKWANFVVKGLGKHCDGNPIFHSIGITGGGMCTGTSIVPEPENIAGGKDGVDELLKKLTLEFGMDQKQLVDHWKYVADVFPAGFKKTRLNFDIDPPIPTRAGQNALDEISDYLIYRYGQRVVLTRQNVDDGKHGFDQYRVIIKFKTDTFTGYRLTNKVTPEDMEKISQTALDDGVSFIELPTQLAVSTDETVKKALSHLRAHLGYQLMLTDAVIPSEIQPGSTMHASFGFVNLGDNVPICAEHTFDKDIPSSYKIVLEFRNSSNKVVALVVHTPAISTMQWVGGKPIQWEESLKMPLLAPGKYAVCVAVVNSNAKQHVNFLNGVGAADGAKPAVTSCASLGMVEFK
jgi:hypothetical protein